MQHRGARLLLPPQTNCEYASPFTPESCSKASVSQVRTPSFLYYVVSIYRLSTYGRGHRGRLRRRASKMGVHLLPFIFTTRPPVRLIHNSKFRVKVGLVRFHSDYNSVVPTFQMIAICQQMACSVYKSNLDPVTPGARYLDGAVAYTLLHREGPTT